jgi:hypothetical protein
VARCGASVISELTQWSGSLTCLASEVRRGKSTFVGYLFRWLTSQLKVIGLFNMVKNHIAISRDCSTSERSLLKLNGIVDKSIPLIVVPLLRCLLYHLSKNELTVVKVYASAVLPLFLACASATYHKLKSLLIDGTPLVDYPYPSDLSLVKIKKDYVVLQIQSIYSCLGLTCDLVGSMKNEFPERTLLASSMYDGNSDLKSLAGYKYLVEQEIIDQASLIDTDIILFFG